MNELPAYSMGLPHEKWGLFPEHIQGLDFGEDLPEQSVIFIDEAAMAFYAREHAREINKMMNVLLSISRQRDQTLIFASHTARKLDIGIVMDMDALIWKEPSRLYARFERQEIREMAQHALVAFEGIKRQDRPKYSVVFSHDTFGELVENPLSDFWCEDISRGFAGVSIKKVEEKGEERELLNKILELENSDAYDRRFGWQIEDVPGLTGGHIAKFLAQGLIRRAYTSRSFKHFYCNKEKIEEYLAS